MGVAWGPDPRMERVNRGGLGRLAALAVNWRSVIWAADQQSTRKSAKRRLDAGAW